MVNWSEVIFQIAWHFSTAAAKAKGREKRSRTDAEAVDFANFICQKRYRPFFSLPECSGSGGGIQSTSPCLPRGAPPM
jgi:hypothetical protein